MGMEFIRQPPESRLCGQSVVAMVLGIPLGEACRRVGHSHATQTKDLIRALGEICLDDRLIEIRHRPLPEYAVVKVVQLGRDPRTGFHWVLRRGPEVYDPALYTKVSLEGWREVRCVRKGCRIVSTLRLRDSGSCAMVQPMSLRVGPQQANEPSFVEFSEPAKNESRVLSEAALIAELRRLGWTLTEDEDGQQVLTEPIRHQ
jgi:hypothetical protein